MRDTSSELFSEPWSLLSKAESRRSLGLQDEAVIAADEAVEAQLGEVFGRLGVPKPASREQGITLLKKKGVKISVARLVRLRELREKAERDGGDTLSISEVEEAISIAEDVISRVGESQECTKFRSNIPASYIVALRKRRAAGFEFHSEGKEIFRAQSFNSPDLVEPLYSNRKGAGQVDAEFVTKLLLARAILNYRKKRIPRFIGLVLVVSSMVACFLFGIIGSSGLLFMLTSRSLFSLVSLAFDFMFLLVAYLFLRMALYVRRQTR